MKTHISQFENYDELIEFFSNPVIQDEIKLRESNNKKIVLTEMIKKILSLYIDECGIKEIKINWTRNKGYEDLNITF